MSPGRLVGISLAGLFISLPFAFVVGPAYSLVAAGLVVGVVVSQFVALPRGLKLLVAMVVAYPTAVLHLWLGHVWGVWQTEVSSGWAPLFSSGWETLYAAPLLTAVVSAGVIAMLPELPLKTQRIVTSKVFTGLCWSVATISVVILGVLFFQIAKEGFHYLSEEFVTNPPSRKPEKAGLGPAIAGSIGICTVCALIALPLGVGTAIFLEEYRPRGGFARRLHGFVQLNIANLAGVPSIVYGIIGLTVFVQVWMLFGNPNEPAVQIGTRWYDTFYDESGEYVSIRVDGRDAPMTVPEDGMILQDVEGNPVTARIVDPAESDLDGEAPMGTILAGSEPIREDMRSWWYAQLPFGRGVLAGGLTLMLVILPIVIISSQEALRAVPDSLREGAFGLGSTRWQVVRRMTLPAAIPGIMTGSILAMSRAIGEAAPILIIAGVVYITFIPKHLMDSFTAMPLQIYDWAGRPQEEFHRVAASGIIVLLAVLLLFNSVAVFIRQKFQKRLS
jgi:phosphate transport system permease protein